MVSLRTLSLSPSLFAGWILMVGWRRAEREGGRERGWQQGLTWALNHALRSPPSTGFWQPHCHHAQATSYASWQHWSRISQSIRCKLELFKDNNEHQDTCRCHWQDATVIGCPSHQALLGLMVVRPDTGWRPKLVARRRWDGQDGGSLLGSVCSVPTCWTLWPDRKTLKQGPAGIKLSVSWHAFFSRLSHTCNSCSVTRAHS